MTEKQVGLVSNKKFFLGVDIGGTKTEVVIGSFDEVLGSTKFATSAELGFDNFVENFRAHFHRLCDSLGVNPMLINAGVIGSPGLLDESRGIVVAAANLGWRNQPILDALRGATGVQRLDLEVDTRCAAVAEVSRGIGKEVNDFIYVTSSTGIGCSIVQKRRIWKGSHGFAGELGQTLIQNETTSVNVTLESLVSGSGIRAHSGVEANLLSEQARTGNRAATKLLQDAGKVLGIAVYNLYQILDPELIVVGGGLMLGSEIYFDAFQNGIYSAPPKNTTRKYRIIKTSLGESAGAYGALIMAVQGKEAFFA